MTEQCTYTGRNITAPSLILHGAPKGDGFDRQHEATLATRMAQTAVGKTPDGVDTLAGRVLRLMRPGKEYLASELAERAGGNSAQSAGAALARLMSQGFVVRTPIRIADDNGARMSWAWRLA